MRAAGKVGYSDLYQAFGRCGRPAKNGKQMSANRKPNSTEVNAGSPEIGSRKD